MPTPNQRSSFSLLDYILGRTGSQGQSDASNFGFLFAETAGQTNSGENVNVDTVLSEPTTMSCINIIAQGITQIPIVVKRKLEDGKYEIVQDHPVAALLQQPNVYQSPSDFKYSMVETILVHGNCYLRIVRANGDPMDGSRTDGRPVQLVPMDPSDVTVGANAFGIPTYTHETYGQIVAENVIHIRDVNTFTALGLSRTLLAAEIIGAKLAADRLMSETFKNGVSVNYAIQSNAPVDATAAENLQKQMKAAFGAGGSKRGSLMLIENGTLNAVKGSTPADADLRALRQELKTEIAGVFRVPAFMVGGTGGDKYNNVRQRLSSFHRDTLQPIITNIEEAITLKLLDGINELVYFDVADFIKGDFENQVNVASTAVSQGIWTPNEGRHYLGFNPADDEHADMLIPPNSTTNTNVEDEDPANATGGSDGPQGSENVGEDDA